MAQKTIRFDYFYPTLDDEQRPLYNLDPILQELREKELPERIITHGNHTRIRLSKIEHYTNYHPNELHPPINFPIWKLIFTKLREDVPGITQVDSLEVNPLDLEPDEYVAEDTVALFDPQKNILIIQRNKTGAAPTAVRKLFLNACRSNFDDLDQMLFCPIIANTAQNQARSLNYLHKIIFRIVDTQSDYVQQATAGDPSISQLLSSLNNFSPMGSSMTAEVHLKMPGREVTRTLKERLVRSLTERFFPLIENDCITKLSLSGRVDEDSQVEDVDFVCDFKREFIEFQLDRTRFIAPTTIFDKILDRYLGHRHQLPDFPPAV